jgi:hypothetical protein
MSIRFFAGDIETVVGDQKIGVSQKRNCVTTAITWTVSRRNGISAEVRKEIPRHRQQPAKK